jgi:hypothetical protein
MAQWLFLFFFFWQALHLYNYEAMLSSVSLFPLVLEDCFTVTMSKVFIKMLHSLLKEGNFVIWSD